MLASVYYIETAGISQILSSLLTNEDAIYLIKTDLIRRLFQLLIFDAGSFQRFR